MHDLAPLVQHLHFLAGVARVLLAANLGDQVHGELVGKGIGRAHRLAGGHAAGLAVELVEAGLAGARGRLVGGADDALEAPSPMERPEGHDADDGRAVGVGDDALLDVLHVLGVDLGDDQGHVGVHAPGVGVVDAEGAGGRRDGQLLLGQVVAHGREEDVELAVALGCGDLDGDLLPAEGHGAPRVHAALRGEGHDLLHGEIALLEALQHLRAHDARCTQDADDFSAHDASLL